jgi:DNA-binding MarR family transcriptional regulator
MGIASDASSQEPIISLHDRNSHRFDGGVRALDARTSDRQSSHYQSPGGTVTPVSPLDQRQYEQLLSFRTGLRRFLRWSAEQARAAGLTPAQHQLLLAIRGHPDPAGPTIGEVAQSLLLRHHSTVELVDRAQAAGLVERHPDTTDSRVVRLSLTPLGTNRLETLTAMHLEELARLEPQLQGLWHGLGTTFDDVTSAG